MGAVRQSDSTLPTAGCPLGLTASRKTSHSLSGKSTPPCSCCASAQLRELELYHGERQPQSVLDGGMLSALRSLESLHVEAWGRVALGGGGVLLPRLERCSVLYCERVEVDTALPRLQVGAEGGSGVVVGVPVLYRSGSGGTHGSRVRELGVAAGPANACTR